MKMMLISYNVSLYILLIMDIYIDISFPSCTDDKDMDNFYSFSAALNFLTII